MKLTAAGWVFLVTAWIAVGALAGWWLYRVLGAVKGRK